MSNERNAEYSDALDQHADEQREWFVRDIFERLDSIEKNLETEASRILMQWVRDSIIGVKETYDNREH